MRSAFNFETLVEFDTAKGAVPDLELSFNAVPLLFVNVVVAVAEFERPMTIDPPFEANAVPMLDATIIPATNHATFFNMNDP